ncbi:MAG: cupin domain-containing protein [Zhaonellaceae bacterium]
MRITKKLITVLELKDLTAGGQKELFLEPGTIITPAARDEAKQRGIVFRTGLSSEPVPNQQPAGEQSCLDPELVERIVREVLAAFPGLQSRQQAKEIDPSGLVLVRKECCNKEQSQEILTRAESPQLSSGFITLEGESLKKNSACDEVNYLLEGTVNLAVNGRNYQLKAGDVFYIPKETSLVLSAQQRARIFYVAYRSC